MIELWPDNPDGNKLVRLESHLQGVACNGKLILILFDSIRQPGALERE